MIIWMTYLEQDIVGGFKIFAQKYLPCCTDYVETVLAIGISTYAILKNILNNGKR